MATWYAANKLRLSVTFTDSGGNAIDPSTVSLKYGLHGGAATTQGYNPGNIVRDSLGSYHFDVDITGLLGQWDWEWLATGTGQAAMAGSEFIEALPF